MKKIIAVLCTCLALFGCSEKTEEKTDTSVKITVSFWEPGMGKELSAGMQQVIDDYHELHPEVEVEMLIYPVTEYNEHMRKLYSVNNLPDIISNHSSQLLLMARQGLLADLTEELSMPSAYEPQAAWEKVFDKQFLGLVNSMYETKRYNLPFFNNETAVFYNREIYQELGLEIPKTWEELLSNFDVIQKSGKTAMAIMADKGDIKLWLDWELGNEIGLEKLLENPDININGDVISYELANGKVIIRKLLYRIGGGGELNKQPYYTSEGGEYHFNVPFRAMLGTVGKIDGSYMQIGFGGVRDDELVALSQNVEICDLTNGSVKIYQGVRSDVNPGDSIIITSRKGALQQLVIIKK